MSQRAAFHAVYTLQHIGPFCRRVTITSRTTSRSSSCSRSSSSSTARTHSQTYIKALALDLLRFIYVPPRPLPPPWPSSLSSSGRPVPVHFISLCVPVCTREFRADSRSRRARLGVSSSACRVKRCQWINHGKIRTRAVLRAYCNGMCAAISQTQGARGSIPRVTDRRMGDLYTRIGDARFLCTWCILPETAQIEC